MAYSTGRRAGDSRRTGDANRRTGRTLLRVGRHGPALPTPAHHGRPLRDGDRGTGGSRGGRAGGQAEDRRFDRDRAPEQIQALFARSTEPQLKPPAEEIAGTFPSAASCWRCTPDGRLRTNLQPPRRATWLSVRYPIDLDACDPPRRFPCGPRAPRRGATARSGRSLGRPRAGCRAVAGPRAPLELVCRGLPHPHRHAAGAEPRCRRGRRPRRGFRVGGPGRGVERRAEGGAQGVLPFVDRAELPRARGLPWAGSHGALGRLRAGRDRGSGRRQDAGLAADRARGSVVGPARRRRGAGGAGRPGLRRAAASRRRAADRRDGDGWRGAARRDALGVVLPGEPAHAGRGTA